MARQHTVAEGYARLAQAVIIRAISDQVLSFKLYDDIFAPVIQLYNEMHPDKSISDPMMLLHHQPGGSYEIFQSLSALAWCLIDILCEYNPELDRETLTVNALSVRYTSKSGAFDRMIPYLFDHTGVKWSKDVYYSSEEVLKHISKGSYVMFKRYDKNARIMRYKRVTEEEITAEKYKGAYIIIAPQTNS